MMMMMAQQSAIIYTNPIRFAHLFGPNDDSNKRNIDSNRLIMQKAISLLSAHVFIHSMWTHMTPCIR